MMKIIEVSTHYSN